MGRKIEKLRKKIDKVDKEIISLLFERLEIAKEILKEKREIGLPLTDFKRENEIIQKLKKISKSYYLEDLISEIYPSVFDAGKKIIVFEENRKLNFNKIGILGLGLIGGSIARAIKAKKPKSKIFTLFRKNDKDIQEAKEEKCLDKIFKNLKELLNEVEILIIATPIEVIIPLARKVAKESNFSKKILVIDVGSTKEKIVREFEKLNKENIDFLGTHPMAGSEKQGFSFSSPLLFLNHSWIITPHRKNKKENVRKVENLVKFLGAKPLKATAKEHDLKVAYASHLVFLISRFLFAFEDKKGVLPFTGTGFKSVTRLASSNPEMHFQILNQNKRNIKRALRDFLKFLNKKKNFEKNAKRFFVATKKRRDYFYKQDF